MTIWNIDRKQTDVKAGGRTAELVPPPSSPTNRTSEKP